MNTHTQSTEVMLRVSFFNLQESASAQAKSDENQPPSFPSPIPVHQFLLQSFRTVKHIMKDGNCLFRAVAFHTLGNEDKHDDIRTLLVRFENLNKALFESRFISSAKATTTLSISCGQVFGEHKWNWWLLQHCSRFLFTAATLILVEPNTTGKLSNQ